MAFLVADAELAGQAPGFEAVFVGLHDVDSGALRSLTWVLLVPAAMIIIELDEVDTGGAFAVNIAHIDVKHQGATHVFVIVGPVSAIVIGLVEDEGAVV